MASKARVGLKTRILQSRRRPVRYRDGRGVQRRGTLIAWVRLRGLVIVERGVDQTVVAEEGLRR